MAKKALLDVLEQTIGKYVRNLDAESLNVAVWSGKIELHNLELDVPAVNAELDRQAAEAPNLAIPFRVLSGKFQKFDVDVPWAHLMSQPVVLRAQGLQVSIEPHDRSEMVDQLYATAESEAARTRRIQEQRHNSIQIADAFRQKSNALRKLAESDVNASSLTSKQQKQTSSSFGARLARRIIENIQMEISDVHVSLEGEDSSAGVVLKSLLLVTTDKEGKRAFVDRTSGAAGLEQAFLHKALQISGLGIYLDEAPSTVSRLSSVQEEDEMEQGLDHSYVLAPLSFEAKLRQADSNVCVDYPKYTLMSELSALSILLSRTQVELFRKIADKMRPAHDVSRPLFPEYRPLSRITPETASEWWKYAFRCIGRLNGRRSWVEFFRAFQTRKKYIAFYKRNAHHANCSWLEALKIDELATLESIERDRSISVEGIMMWRTIADAQYERELEKHSAKKEAATGSLFSSLFRTTATSSAGDEPPISLSVEEMKELEAVNLDQVADAELSSESKLCDVKFSLGSFRIHLTSYDLRQLAALDMGRVSTSFCANMDGSFEFDFKLTSLEIHDKITPNSLFPTVLKNQQRPDVSVLGNEAFCVHLEKTATGDQTLQVVLSTFEAVASPTLLVEVRRFLSASIMAASPRASTQNPILAQSLSGSVDLFYDATEGVVPSHSLLSESDQQQAFAPSAMADFSLGLVDAWKVKTETKSSLIIDLDIQAPILVLPENCVDSRANVLVFDLGHLRFRYGKSSAAPKVSEWFKDHPRASKDGSPVLLDYGSLSISSLTFLVGKANYWRRLVQKHETSSAIGGDEAVLEPISVSIDFGVESRAKDNVPRVCSFAVIPSIALGLSPNQLSKILTVTSAWDRIRTEMFPPDRDSDTVSDAHSYMSATLPRRARSVVAAGQTGSLEIESDETSSPTGSFHVEARLKKLSVSVLTDAGTGIEAHLVSVSTSLTALSDGGSLARISMGWFWIIDRFDNKFPRKQRLVAHSTLPALSSEEANTHNIMQELERIEALQSGGPLSTDLADIVFKRGGGKKSSLKTKENDSEDASGSELRVHAKFSSLYLNWNPLAVKVIASELEKFQKRLRTVESYESPLIVPSHSNRTESQSTIHATEEETSPYRLTAELERFQFCLNSAQDDLPLYVLTMSDAKVSRVSLSDDDIETAVVLGDLTVSTAEFGRTDPIYRTVLGLSPGLTESLLTVKYYEGRRGVAKSPAKETETIEAYGDIELSPMRMVYIHAQVLALVEYSTAGILGSIASQVASTAASAAVEIATASNSRKVFHVKATGLEVILPQAAYRPTALSAYSSELSVEFSTMADTSSTAQVILSGFELRDPAGEKLQEGPVRMSVDVVLPPENVGSHDDQAMRASIATPQASFIVPKSAYEQMLATLEENIGDDDLYLRDDGVELAVRKASSEDELPKETFLTHAGTEFVVKPRRMYLAVEIGIMSLELVSSYDDPIVLITASDASIRLDTYPDEGKTISKVSLRSLSCDDQRLRAVARQYRSLIYQNQKEGSKEDAFSVVYERRDDMSRSAEIAIGSPRLVFIPDAVADILTFLEVPTATEKWTEDVQPLVAEDKEVVQVDVEPSGIETSFVPATLSSMALSLRTSKCSVIFVDLGTDLLLKPGSFGKTSHVASVAETIVFEGKFEVDMSLTNDIRSGELKQLDAQVHGDELESYTAFGRDLESAVQILEPTKVSLYVKARVAGSDKRTLDVRAAAMEPIDTTLSMRNIALMSAILASISTCFEEDKGENTFLNEDEAERIEQLASALEVDDADQSTHSQPRSTLSTGSSFGPRADSSTGVAPRTDVSIHVTAPETLVTVINDLQGLDEPLFRLTVRNSVANAKIRDGQTTKEAPLYTAFEFNTYVSVLSDFFDQTTNSWKVLLLKQWEVSTKGSRGPSQRFQSLRPSTMVDVECFPCYMSFSEQFLMGLASASQMWSVYSRATEQAGAGGPESKELRKSLAASAARKFVATLPYAVENHTGIDTEFVVGDDQGDRRMCEHGFIEYFRFEPPRGRGSAGKRSYGQDISFEKNVTIKIGDTSFSVRNIDDLPGTPRRAYVLENSEVVVVDVVREGKTIVIHLSSGIEIKNNSSVPFSISFVESDGALELGTCTGQSDFKPSVVTGTGGRVSKASRLFGVPLYLAQGFISEWTKNGSAQLRFLAMPQCSDLPDGCILTGTIEAELDSNSIDLRGGGILRQQLEVTCRPSMVGDTGDTERRTGCDPFAFRAVISTELVDGRFPFVVVSLEPRARLENMLPISISVRSPMPHLVGEPSGDGEPDVLEVRSRSNIEIFTPGPSIAVLIKCTDKPVAGGPTGWMEGWLDLPLAQFRLPEPLRCLFPSVRNPSYTATQRSIGSEFFVIQGSLSLLDSFLEREPEGSFYGHPTSVARGVEVTHISPDDDIHSFYVTVCNVGIDHTGDVLFESLGTHPTHDVVRRSVSDMNRSRQSLLHTPNPLGAFATQVHRGRITLLPSGHEYVQLLHLTMEGDEGVRRSSPFLVEDVSICDGGVDATPIAWEDGSHSGFYAYRQLAGLHQSEVHVIPEFIVFNGSKTEKVRIRQPGGLESVVGPGSIAPLRTPSQQAAVISVECIAIGGRTAPLRVDSLGPRLAIVKSQDGFPLGSIAMQTVVGGRDSRLVVKLGEVKFGSAQSIEDGRSSSLGILQRDFLRFRVQWSELQVSLYEARPVAGKESAFFESAMDHLQKVGSPMRTQRIPSEDSWVKAREKMAASDQSPSSVGPVCTILFHRFTIDWQRVFKEDSPPTRELTRSPERSQVSIIIHNIRLRDDTPNSEYPVVFESTDPDASFLDLCIRFRGPLDAELIKVDLFDLNLAHSNGVSQRIVVNTSEDFVWKFLDLADRILVAAGEFAGVDMELAWDDEHDSYKVLIRDKKPSYIEDMTHYAPPQSDMLLDIKKARVSPFAVVVSFKRNPQASRYAIVKGVRGANIMNYFTRRLKFKIDRAELQFARYEAQGIKGPPDRMWEILSTVYASRLKMKFVTLMSAASFEDWKSLAARDDGSDRYLEGDILRATGNIAGTTANAIFRNAGRGLGQGVSFATSTLGSGIETATGAVGAKPVGAGVNSVVSGMGDGVAQTLTGVGKGAGKVFKGAGQGVGHVFGGVTGGALMVGKGIGKGITTGDGRAVVSGVTQGAVSVGAGVGQGVESVVTGATEGVLSVGQGLFSGVKTVGRGIGGAFTGKKPKRRRESDDKSKR